MTESKDISDTNEEIPAHDDAREFAVAAARIADEQKTEGVVVLDLRGLSGLADFFVIGTGSSERQMHSVMDHLHDYSKTVGRRPFNVADRRATSWVLADYVDVVVHIFDEKHRDYYDLDSLWGDAPHVDWKTEVDRARAKA